MLSYYTPFIQFIAAIYFSMCFEQLIEKFFWNKQHEEKIKYVIQKIKNVFSLTENDEKEIMNTIDQKHHSFIRNVQKWSISMLVFLIIILFLSGIESCFSLIIPYSCWIITLLSLLILAPAGYLFVLGWCKTLRYEKKMNRIIDREIVVFYRNTQDCIAGNKENEDNKQILASVFENIQDGDTINKTTILSEIMTKFKEESIRKIKAILIDDKSK